MAITGACPTMITSLNVLAGLQDFAGRPTVSAARAADVYSGNTGPPFLEIVGALNRKAGNDGTTLAKAPRDLDGVANQLAGTTGLSATAALAVLAGLASA